MPRTNARARGLLQQVTSHYLKSPDFNGIRIDELLTGKSPDAINIVRDLVRRQLIEVISGKWDNPYIRRMPPRSIEKQVEILRSTDDLICVYPTIKHMKRAIPPRLFRDRYFSRRLALGHPQIEPLFFELAVLDRYQSDPRYSFKFWGLDGSISMTEKYYRSREMLASDKIMIGNFGLASSPNGRRLVAVYLRYLSGMPAKHQGHWRSHRVHGACKIESNYYLRSTYGEWTDGISVYSAVLAELFHINKLCEIIGLPALFRNDFSKERPKGFGLLMNTTFHEYLNFVHLLDKIISENLNQQFFEVQGVSMIDPQTNQRRGTLGLLEEWLNRTVRIEGNNGAAKVIAPLKRVRKERQPDAHAIVRDEFSRRFQKMKEELISDVYVAISNIRMFFQTHPLAKTYIFPKGLKPKNIVLY